MKFLFFLSIVSLASTLTVAGPPSPERPYILADRFHTLNYEEIPVWDSVELMQRFFEEVRDDRFVTYQHNGFKRGIPYLYPDDGCHTRSQMVIDQALKKDFVKPKKIFIFGMLQFTTPYGIDSRYTSFPEVNSGNVLWFFHTAPIIKVDGEVYVLDHALDDTKPLKIKDWALKLTPDFTNVNFAICSGDTYLETDSCIDPKFDQDVHEEAIQFYLQMEWNRIRYLELDPYTLLK